MAAITSTLEIIDKASKTLIAVQSQVKKLNTDMDTLKKSLGNVDLDHKINAQLQDANKKVIELGNSVENTAQSFSKWDVAVGSILAQLITKVAQFGIQAVKTGIEFNASMENYMANFKVLLGSVDEAKIKITELQEFANKTPFEIGDLARATQVLLGFGIANDETLGILNKLGDIAQGNKEKFGNLALVYGQIVAAGRLLGQDLLQLINAGFNPLLTLSEKTGKSLKQLRDEMTKGEISAQMIAEAFSIATSEGGRFFNGMQEGAKTFTGVFSTFVDTVRATLGGIFEPLTSILKSTMQTITTVLQNMQPVIANFNNFIAENTESIKAILISLGVVATGVAIKTAIAWVIAFAPIILIILGVVLVIGVLIVILNSLGITSGDVVGAIIGAFMFMGAIIYNVIEGIKYIILNFGVLINQIVYAILNGMIHGVTTTIDWLVDKISNFLIWVLNGVKWLAERIDSIFHLGWGDKVAGWQEGISNWNKSVHKSSEISRKAGPGFEKAEWVPLKQKNEFAEFNKGMQIGQNLMSGGAIGSNLNFNTQFDKHIGTLGNQQNALDNINAGVGGLNDKLSGKGSLGSIGKVKESNIKEENLKYLKDLASAKYQKEYQKIPISNRIDVSVNTGNINTSADEKALVNKILGAIESAMKRNLNTQRG